ncbi:MAG: helix-turn-helix domain-containing protein [Candidatus Fimenecus sp.]
MNFAQKLKQLRKSNQMTQQDAANAIGIAKRTYVSYELDGRYPRNHAIYEKIAQVFGVNKNYLLTEDEEFISEASEQFGYRGQAEAIQLVSQLSGLFAGGQLSDEEADGVMIALQKAYFDRKLAAKEKYTPKKFKSYKEETL